MKEIDEGYNLPALLDSWYKTVINAPRLKKWYFGHMHVDKLITPKLRGVYNDFLLAGDEKPIPWA